jgi:hypothetical protein
MRFFFSAVFLLGTAVAHTWPLAAHLDDAIPGRGLGDNVTSLWIFWWMREAVARGDVSFFFTSYLFAPAGTPLVLHTHTAPLALIGATVLAGMSTAASLNLVLIGAVFLNGAVAYALAYHVTCRSMPALLAGVLFMLAPPLLARMMGHFNLVQAWTLVLAVWLWLRMRSARSAIAAGAALGLVAWTDYYLFIYTLGIIATLGVASRWRFRLTTRPPRDSAATVGLALLALLCLAIAMWIRASGVTALTLGGVRVSMRSADNPLMAMWLLAIAAVVVRWQIRPRIERRGDRTPQPTDAAAVWTRTSSVALMACAAALLPLAWLALDLWSSGGYATQQTSWRTAPRGADLATFIAGPPFHPLVGGIVRGIYARFGIDVMESSGWLGVSACVLAALAVRRRPLERAARLWLTVGTLFMAWALGPFLIVGGFNTGLILPQQLLRYLPVLGNARMPARALIVVSLALAVLAAIAAANRSRRFVIGALIVVCVELIGAPLPLASLDVPAVYARLAAMPPGRASQLPPGVLELPLGFRDGFGVTGDFDDRTLLYQTVHRHPMAGGFVARLSPSVRRAYGQDKTLNALLNLSSALPATLPGCDQAVSGLRGSGFGYVVVDRTRMPAALTAYISSWPLTRLAQSDGRELFRLDDARCPANLRAARSATHRPPTQLSARIR